VKSNMLDQAGTGQKVIRQVQGRDANSIWGQCARFCHRAGRWALKIVLSQAERRFLCRGLERKILDHGSCWCDHDRDSLDCMMVNLGMKNLQWARQYQREQDDVLFASHAPKGGHRFHREIEDPAKY
jgi:hypothetical protein